MNSAEGLKDEEPCVLDEVLQASNQEEVIHKNLRDGKKFMLEHCTTVMKAMLISINLGHWPKIHTTEFGPDRVESHECFVCLFYLMSYVIRGKRIQFT